MERLSGLESYLLHMESDTSPGHVSSLGIYDPASAPSGAVAFADIQRFLAARIHRHGMFRRRVAALPLRLARPYWVDQDGFDIEYHVRRTALPKPRDWRQLTALVARLHARPLDLSRPLWECYVIEELDGIPGLPPGAFALLIKVHGAALGGELETQLLAALHELSPASKVSAPKERPFYDHPPAALDLALRNAVDAAAWPFEAGRYLLSHLAPIVGLGAGLGAGSVRRRRGGQAGPDSLGIDSAAGYTRPPMPATQLNGRLSRHRVVTGATFELARLEALCGKLRAPDGSASGAAAHVAMAHLADINDVTLAIVGGALRRYLHGRMDLPAVSLCADAPYSARAGQHGGSETRRGAANTAVLALHTDIADPLARLRKIAEHTRAQRASPRAYLSRRLALDALDFVPTLLCGLYDRTVPQLGRSKAVNTVVHRVQGPAAPLYFAGAELLLQFGFVPLRAQAGIAHTVSHYHGLCTIGVTACRSVLPDAERYADCLRAACGELADAVQP